MEYNLTDCETRTGTRQSSHDEDIGVKCRTGKLQNNSYALRMRQVPSSYIVDENIRSGDIRLVGGQHNWEGRVEVFLSGTWGAISSTTWATTEAKVVCRQLNLPSQSESKL